MLSDATLAKRQECIDFAFNRIKHPQLDVITEDSLRKCLIDNDIKLSTLVYDREDEFGLTESDRILREMIKMANLAKKGKPIGETE